MFQAFLTTFLIDSGYRTPIRNLDELFASGVKVADPYGYNFIFVKDNETEVSKIQRNIVDYRIILDCIYWAKFHKNISIFFSDIIAEYIYVVSYIFFENSDPLFCRLEDGVVYNNGLRMAMLNGDPLLR